MELAKDHGTAHYNLFRTQRVWCVTVLAPPSQRRGGGFSPALLLWASSRPGYAYIHRFRVLKLRFDRTSYHRLHLAQQSL